MLHQMSAGPDPIVNHPKNVLDWDSTPTVTGFDTLVGHTSVHTRHPYVLVVALFGDGASRLSPSGLRRHNNCYYLLSIGEHPLAHSAIHHCWSSNPESLRTYTPNDTSPSC